MWFSKQKLIKIALDSNEFYKELSKGLNWVYPRNAATYPQELPSDVFLLTGAKIQRKSTSLRPVTGEPRADIIPYRQISIQHRLLDHDNDQWGVYHYGSGESKVKLYFSLTRPGLIVTDRTWNRVKERLYEVSVAARLYKTSALGLNSNEIAIGYSAYGLSKAAADSADVEEFCRNLRHENGSGDCMFVIGNKQPLLVFKEDINWSPCVDDRYRVIMEVPKLQLAVAFSVKLRFKEDGTYHVSVPEIRQDYCHYVVLGPTEKTHITFFDPIQE